MQAPIAKKRPLWALSPVARWPLLGPALLLSSLFFTATGTAASAATESADSTSLLRLATTTSPDHSGLLDSILPLFTEQTGIEVHVIAVGTGKALRLGQGGDVDVVLVHAPEREETFVEAGFGTYRRAVMFNDLVIVGPEDNPAGLLKDAAAVEAVAAIAAARAPFVSRGDDSGTHLAERELWRTAEITPKGRWYRESGRGMASVLQMANELGAYTLTDRGTWIALRKTLPHLMILNEGDPRLYNPYSVIAVDPARHRHVNHRGALLFIDWLTSAPVQARIGSFAINGSVMFFPAIKPSE